MASEHDREDGAAGKASSRRQLLAAGTGTAEPKDVIEELFRRGEEGDYSVIDELIAEDMVNHAAGPARQGREGWKQIIESIRTSRW